MDRKLLNSKEICTRLSINSKWIPKQMWRIQNDLAKADTLPPLLKIGGRYMCYEDELTAWIESQRIGVQA